MNIQFQIAGVIILLIIYVLYWKQGRVLLGNQRIFQNVLIGSTINLLLDGTSVVAIKMYAGQKSLFLDLLCKAYLVTLVILIYYSYKYIIFEIIQHDGRLVKFNNGLNIVKYVCCVLIMVVPIYNVWEDQIYTYGPSTTITYAFAFLVIALNYFNLFKFRKAIEKRRWIASFSWMGLWVVAAFVQLFNSQILVVGFAGAIAAAILYMKLENPESYLDRETSIFNQHSLYLYMTELSAKDKAFRLLVIGLELEQKECAHSLETRVLREVAYELDKIEGTILFRNQEKEFILLIQDENKMNEIEDKVTALCEEYWNVNDMYYRVVASCYEICNSEKNASKQLDLVRAFVNEKREAAKNSIVIMDDEWVRHRQRKTNTEQMIYNAIAQDRVVVYYQPIYSLENNSFCSAEALVRIEDEDGGIISPGVFIQVAEDNESIIQLGEIIFEKVCRMIVEEKLEDKGFEYIEVNVSSVQSTKSDFADKYIEIMERTGVNPKMINLEITETAAVRSKEILLANMIRLIKYGVSFSLDDFGTGYSNLNYIVELPVKIVKFDKNMTDSYFESEKAKVVMSSAINMIQAVGMQIVVEGVEKENQLVELKQEDIDYIQGFYFSRPVPKERFIKNYCGEK